MYPLQRLLPLFLAFLAQACVIDVGDVHGPGPGAGRRPIDRGPTPLQWGDACAATFQCAAGLHCLDAVCEPERVGIYPVGALVAPGDMDGRQWHRSWDALPYWVLDELSYARREGVDAQFDFMDYVWEWGLAAPSPYGYGYLAVDGWYDERFSLTLLDRGWQDREVFYATWPQPTGWTDVPFDQGLSVAFDLYSEGRREDLSIGLVELDLGLLRHALHRGGVVWFDTYAATDGQLLLFGVEVVPES